MDYWITKEVLRDYKPVANPSVKDTMIQKGGTKSKMGVAKMCVVYYRKEYMCWFK